MRLPIDELIPEIVQHLRGANNLVLEAPPGAGKTTRVPPALLALDPREVLVLEPRRLAARLAARYVAGELQEHVGETVGYHVRFEEVAGPNTRLRFLTEGVLTRRLLSDPTLDRVACVVLDEFHERHLEGDLALALLRRLQRTRRPDLKLVVMSATLDAAPIAAYLDHARILRSAGRQHALEIEYTPHSAAPIEDQIAGALERLAAHAFTDRLAARPGTGRLAAGAFTGHALVFLPGAFEIRRAQTACASIARRHNWQLLPLYGDQSPEEQDRAVAPSVQTKIILSTNVAESSITIDGVNAVIDSGLARIASHSPWSGLPTLQIARISQASANQRAGRAGRTGPGRAIRLYPLEDFVRRPAHDVPQILREDLSPTALLLHALNADLAGLDWLDAPPPAAIEHAEDLLRQLGATGATAREMERYPLHPRLARLVVEARRRGVVREGAALAALLSAGERLPQHVTHGSRSDLLVLLESEWSPYATRLVHQLVRQVGGGAARGGVRNTAHEDALLISVLTAFPDRVARRRQGADLQLANGTSVQQAPNSTVTADLMIAVEAEDRKDRQSPLVRLASAIEPEWLLDLFPERLRETSTLEWNRSGERVEAVTSLLFDQIPIESRRTPPDLEAIGIGVGVLLARKAVEAGLGRFADMEEVAALQARINFAAQYGPIPPLDEAAIEGALASLAVGLKSFAELEAAAGKGGLPRAIENQMPGQLRRLLDQLAPASVRLPRGRQLRVHYEPNQPPWIASRLQDFFGMRETPSVGRGTSPLVLHLLAPNQRPVQMTSDLAGFWQRLYPQVRRELARRYPRHAWPEDPLA